MTPTRRDILKAGSLVALGASVPAFLARTALAAPDAGQAGSRDTILVVVEMFGGNDGLNTVVPFKDAEYRKFRPTLALPANRLHKISDELGLHPAMSGFAELLNKEQALCVVQGVGYPNPTQSHFISRDIWHSARQTEPRTEGWIGRALKALPSAPAFHLAGANESAPLSLSGAPVRVPSITSLEDFQLRLAASGGKDRKNQQEVIESAVKDGSNKPGLLDFVQRTASNTYAASQRLQEIGRNYQPRATYPNTPLANKLRLAAQLIEADLGARIFYVFLDSFDTHASQAGAHAGLLGQVSAAMTAFYKDLAARGHKERLLMMTLSEFGRRVKENGSGGTDHGAAAPMFLVGGKVRPGVVGRHPSLTDLAFGNLKHHTDFRQVYAAVLDQWLGVSSKDVLGGTYLSADVLKS